MGHEVFRVWLCLLYVLFCCLAHPLAPSRAREGEQVVEGGAVVVLMGLLYLYQLFLQWAKFDSGSLNQGYSY